MHRLVLTAACAAMLITTSAWAADPPTRDRLVDDAMRAHADGDIGRFLALTNAAFRLAPGDETVMYNLACGYALSGDAHQASMWLERLASVGSGWEAERDADFDMIRNNPEFRAAMRKVRQAREPVSNAEIGFSLPAADVLPTALAWDPVERILYVSSAGRGQVLAIGMDGRVREPVGSPRDGLGRVLGIAIDPLRRSLWVTTTAPRRRTPAGGTGTGAAIQQQEAPQPLGAAVLVFDLRSRRLARTLQLSDGPHLFRAVTVNRYGDAYVADSLAGTVYAVYPGHDEMERLFPIGQFPGAAALAFDGAASRLYIAHDAGVACLDLGGGGVFALGRPSDLLMTGIEWLGWHRDRLVAIQPDARRVSVFTLNPQRNAVTAARTLEANNPLFEGRAGGGSIVDDTLYVIANSGLAAVDGRGGVRPPDRVQPAVVLRLALAR